MGTLTASASMRDWHKSGWVIKASHILAGVETPPPPPTPPGELRESLDDEAYREEIEDIAAAKRALEDYEASGLGGTSSYSEYRAQRLGTES